MRRMTSNDYSWEKCTQFLWIQSAKAIFQVFYDLLVAWKGSTTFFIDAPGEIAYYTTGTCCNRSHCFGPKNAKLEVSATVSQVKQTTDQERISESLSVVMDSDLIFNSQIKTQAFSKLDYLMFLQDYR